VNLQDTRYVTSSKDIVKDTIWAMNRVSLSFVIIEHIISTTHTNTNTTQEEEDERTPPDRGKDEEHVK
jgi:hypothetical protein